MRDQPKSEPGMTWRSVGPYARLSLEDLEALPPGRVRSFELDGVRVAAWKMREDGMWRVLSRRIPAKHLADALSVERVRVPREDQL
jgi:hypothetical protein